MVIYIITNLNSFKLINTYNKLLLPINIKNIQKFSSSKYILK